jgi:hypothetical protein
MKPRRCSGQVFVRSLFRKLSKDPYSDPHDVDETDVDVVGVVWRKGLPLPPVPGRPTVEGTLRPGNRELGEQMVAIPLENAVPVPLNGNGRSALSDCK